MLRFVPRELKPDGVVCQLTDYTLHCSQALAVCLCDNVVPWILYHDIEIAFVNIRAQEPELNRPGSRVPLNPKP